MEKQDFFPKRFPNSEENFIFKIGMLKNTNKQVVNDSKNIKDGMGILKFYTVEISTPKISYKTFPT